MSGHFTKNSSDNISKRLSFPSGITFKEDEVNHDDSNGYSKSVTNTIHERDSIESVSEHTIIPEKPKPCNYLFIFIFNKSMYYLASGLSIQLVNF